MPAATDRRLLYIAGYGRSGSTVLDIALSCHPQVEGMGELTGFFEAIAESPDALSPFWRDVAAAVTGSIAQGPAAGVSPEEIRGAARTVARAERLLPGSALFRRSKLRARYRHLQATILDELFDRTGAAVLVDSSKSSWLHTWRLSLLVPLVPEVHCLVLVRDLAGVVRSVRRGHGETLQAQRLPVVRAILGWTVATVTAVAVGRLACGRDRTRLVRHETFVADPAGHLAAAYDQLGLVDGRPAIEDGVTNGFRPRHQVLGNRVRSQERVEIRQLPSGGDRLPFGVRLVITAVSALVETLAVRQLNPLEPLPSAGPTTDPGRTEGAHAGPSTEASRQPA